MLPPREWMENSSARSKWICTPGQHIVRIVGYKQDSKKSGKPVIFELQDDHGRKQTIRFLQSTTALKAGQLLRFVVAAKQLAGAGTSRLRIQRGQRQDIQVLDGPVNCHFRAKDP